MKKQRKITEKPLKPFDRERIESERHILLNYGLRRKREIWRAESILRNFRRNARELLAKRDKEREKQLVEKLKNLGLEVKHLDDVLMLAPEKILDRRLQTLVFKKNLAKSLKQARQMIVHGNIAIGGKRARFPSMLVDVEQESKIGLYAKASATNKEK